jgi:hypothetical protein
MLEAFLRDLAAQAEEFERTQPLAAEGAQAPAAGGAAGFTAKQALAFVGRWRGYVSASRARVGTSRPGAILSRSRSGLACCFCLLTPASGFHGLANLCMPPRGCCMAPTRHRFVLKP